MLTLTATVKSETGGDLELALEELRRLVKGGALSGGGETNVGGSIWFDIEGAEEPAEDDALTDTRAEGDCKQCGAEDVELIGSSGHCQECYATEG